MEYRITFNGFEVELIVDASSEAAALAFVASAASAEEIAPIVVRHASVFTFGIGDKAKDLTIGAFSVVEDGKVIHMDTWSVDNEEARKSYGAAAACAAVTHGISWAYDQGITTVTVYAARKDIRLWALGPKRGGYKRGVFATQEFAKYLALKESQGMTILWPTNIPNRVFMAPVKALCEKVMAETPSRVTEPSVASAPKDITVQDVGAGEDPEDVPWE